MTTAHLRKAALLGAFTALATTPALAFLPVLKGEIFGQLQVGATWDSNIYNSNTEITDYILTGSPSVLFVRNAGLLKLNADAGVDIVRFNNYDKFNGENGFTHGQLTWADAEGKSDAQLNGSIVRNASANAYLNDRTISDDYSLKGTFGNWVTEKLGFRASAEYFDSTAVSGGYSDVRRSQFGFDGRYLSSPKLELVGGYAFGHTGNYGGSAASTELRTNDHRFSGGVDGELTSKIKGKARVGYVFRRFTQSSNLEDTSSPFAKVDLEYQAAEKTLINLVANKDFDTSAANQSINKFDVTLSATQELNAKLKVTAAAIYTHGKYEGGSVGRSDDSVSGQLSAVYQFTDLASAAAYVSHTRSDSTLKLADYDHAMVGASVVLRF